MSRQISLSDRKAFDDGKEAGRTIALNAGVEAGETLPALEGAVA